MPKTTAKSGTRPAPVPGGAKTSGDGQPASKGPLSAELLRKMDAYWRASNYLSVGQIYLFANPLLRKPKFSPLQSGREQFQPLAGCTGGHQSLLCGGDPP